MSAPNQGDREPERAPVPYELIDHTADIGFRVRGRDLGQLFARAALALHDIIADTAAARPVVERQIRVISKSLDEALIRFLEEAHYLFEVEKILLAEVHAEVVDVNGAGATVRGEPFDPRRHELRRPVKAVTYHDLAIEPAPDSGFEARVILDL